MPFNRIYGTTYDVTRSPSSGLEFAHIPDQEYALRRRRQNETMRRGRGIPVREHSSRAPDINPRQRSTRNPLNAGLAPKQLASISGYLSISPITMSSEPTMAGTSAIRQPRQRSAVTDRLQNELLRARTRQGIAFPSLTK